MVFEMSSELSFRHALLFTFLSLIGSIYLGYQLQYMVLVGSTFHYGATIFSYRQFDVNSGPMSVKCQDTFSCLDLVCQTIEWDPVAIEITNSCGTGYFWDNTFFFTLVICIIVAVSTSVLPLAFFTLVRNKEKWYKYYLILTLLHKLYMVAISIAYIVFLVSFFSLPESLIVFQSVIGGFYFIASFIEFGLATYDHLREVRYIAI